MRLTPYGRREIAVSLILLGAIAAGAWLFGGWLSPFLRVLAIFPAIVFLWVIYFFRDPVRQVPTGEGLLICPADGEVTHIDEVEEDQFIGGKAMRISIFMNIFSVHVNRAPFAGKVAHVKHRDGQFVNAMSGDSSHLNEANDMGIETGEARMPKVMVRQIAGLIARRIVCDRKVGDSLKAGEIFGMIKFSSRVEVFLPAETKLNLKVGVGDKVRAGLDILGELTA
ncbi:MAG: phosphatidylserine decarboxylase family protein [Planctomycetes bacterium]|nr:phosphatidylserine decarboxylase family protein [Planctomycetota bacterium]